MTDRLDQTLRLVPDGGRISLAEPAIGGPLDEIPHPIARRLLSRCDAVPRSGGPPAGADELVERARAAGKAVFTSMSEVPTA